MTSYADFDGVIAEWVKRASSTLYTEWAGEPARFFHLPGLPPHECFQISVGLGSTGSVTVLARSIDTNDGSEWEQAWEGSPGELNTMLAAAVERIETWKWRTDPRPTDRH